MNEHVDTFSSIIADCNDAVCRKVGGESIIEFAEKEIVLGTAHGTSGPIRLGGSRYAHEPLLSIQDRETVCTTILKPVQTLGTVIGEIGLVWYMVNRPGNFHWLTETDDKARDQMERLKPLFKNCKPLIPLLPQDERRMSANGLTIPSCILKVTGNALSNLQSATKHLLVVDELAHYDDTTILYEIESRISYTKEVGNAKIIIISQAGLPGNELDVSYKKGTMEEWMLPCESCKQFIAPDISMFSAGGRKFNDPELQLKDDDNNYIQGKVEKLITFDCPYCNHHMVDSPKLKRYWNENGKYIAQNPNPAKGYRSFHWTQIHCKNWTDIVMDWLKVCRMRKNGNSDEFKKFLQKRMAKSYNPQEYFDDSKIVKTSRLYDVSKKWEDEFVTIMTVDVQKDRFYAVIRTWAKDGRSRMQWAGWLLTVDQVVAKQEEYGVSTRADKLGKNDRKCVMWDSGYAPRRNEVYGYCVQHKHIAIKGDTSGTKQFDHIVVLPNGKKVNRPRPWTLSGTRGDPHEGLAGQGRGPTCPLVILATDVLKKALVQLRDGHGPEWLVLDKELHPSWDDYNTGIFNEEFYLTDIRGKPLKTGMWKKVNEGLTNESFDCEAYQLGAAVMCGVNIDLLNNLPSQQYLVSHTSAADSGNVNN